jgi:glycosyltransferase involved in cell wall biosynthesis
MIAGPFAHGYHYLEIVVIDGGFTNDSVQIVREYEDTLAPYESEDDHGQGNTINKCFAPCSDHEVNVMRSDDKLMLVRRALTIPRACRCAGHGLKSHVESGHQTHIFDFVYMNGATHG